MNFKESVILYYRYHSEHLTQTLVIEITVLVVVYSFALLLTDVTSYATGMGRPSTTASTISSMDDTMLGV